MSFPANHRELFCRSFGFGGRWGKPAVTLCRPVVLRSATVGAAGRHHTQDAVTPRRIVSLVPRSVPRRRSPLVGSAQLRGRSTGRAGLGKSRDELQGHPRVKVMRDALYGSA